MGTPSIVFGIAGWLIYTATRSRFFGKPYRRVTVLLPLLQMCLYTSLALNAGLIIVNKWADTGSYSKGWAIVLALLAFVVIRLLMSLLYWKYPFVPKNKGKDWGG